MSNIFAPYAKIHSGIIKFNNGAIGTVVKNQHLNCDDQQQIYAVVDGTIDHYGAGLPFDSQGRLVTTNTAKVRTDQGIPFAANGGIPLGGATSYYDQGIAFDATGALATT
jgi:hypothetical protein